MRGVSHGMYSVCMHVQGLTRKLILEMLITHTGNRKSKNGHQSKWDRVEDACVEVTLHAPAHPESWGPGGCLAIDI